MQLLPSTSAMDLYSDPSSMGRTNTGASNDSGFTSVLSSFIEEGRTDYTGLPPGFSAYVTEGGTISRDQVELLRKNLKANDAHDASLEALNQMLASGGPMSVGKIFSVLQGTTRTSEAMSDDDRQIFRKIMGQLGASQEEVDTMLEASDKGDGKTVWNMLVGKWQEKEGDTELSKAEALSLLRSLDLSSETKSFIMKYFKDQDQLSLNREQMAQLFSAAEKELMDRENAQTHVKSVMREAMTASLEESRVKNLADPVADLRGSRRMEQTEELMNASSMKKNGLHDLIRLAGKEEETLADERAFHERDTTGWKAPQSKEVLPDKPKKAGTIRANIPESGMEKVKDAAPSMFARIETSPLEGAQPVSNQKDLLALARQHRQEIFTQVESGFLQNRTNGSHQLTLQLNPEDLGQLSLILNVKQGEVRAIIRADQHESAAAISEQLGQLKAALEEQGLKVAEIEVRTGLQDDSATADHWNNRDDHNMMRDARERDRNRQLANLRREAGQATEQATSQAADNVTESREQASTRLHIVA